MVTGDFNFLESDWSEWVELVSRAYMVYTLYHSQWTKSVGVRQINIDMNNSSSAMNNKSGYGFAG